MNSTKKTLTTLSAAAAMALGGVAIAQGYSSGDTSSQPAPLGSSSTMQNTGDASQSSSTTLGAPSSDTSTLGASSSATTTETTTDTSASPVVQMDRN